MARPEHEHLRRARGPHQAPRLALRFHLDVLILGAACALARVRARALDAAEPENPLLQGTRRVFSKPHSGCGRSTVCAGLDSDFPVGRGLRWPGCPLGGRCGGSCQGTCVPPGGFGGPKGASRLAAGLPAAHLLPVRRGPRWRTVGSFDPQALERPRLGPQGPWARPRWPAVSRLLD